MANHAFFTVADLNYYVFLEKLPQWVFCKECFFAVLLISSQPELGNTVHEYNIIVASGSVLVNTIFCEHQTTSCWPKRLQALEMIPSLASLSTERSVSADRKCSLWERDCAFLFRKTYRVAFYLVHSSHQSFLTRGLFLVLSCNLFFNSLSHSSTRIPFAPPLIHISQHVIYDFHTYFTLK